ncbi:hypothetical protein FOMPIDRAFT_1033872 [Fomitopsis schrenkii]|uniref:GH16 domain-containing protein n=1 Tax=Fomitopsis schrenkii TaxID=2126942 RepID=S8DJD1_FOMSC|nr:hypothetical protein FOMPIDRAFT_1033872 [Fomitopsis schrenkii]
MGETCAAPGSLSIHVVLVRMAWNTTRGDHDGWESGVASSSLRPLTSGHVLTYHLSSSTNQQVGRGCTTGTAIIEVNNTMFMSWNDKRHSDCITTSDFFDSGSVFIFDASHMLYGCSIWPSFWTKGENWPAGGEIDIMEVINGMTENQMALQLDQWRVAHAHNRETNRNSYGPGFAASGGGVFTTLFDDTQIAIWFWPRSSVPASVSSVTSSMDISEWGTPLVNYTSSACNIGTPQQLVLDVTLYGDRDWAGVVSIYTETGCAILGGRRGERNVINNGNTTAYFEINYIKVFNRNGTVLGAGGATSSVDASATCVASKGASATGSEILSYVLCLANIYK